MPDGGGFAIAAGLEQLIDYIENLHFSPEDIAIMRGRNLFSEEFLSYLEDFHFTGDIYAMPEGTPVFPREPMVIVRAKAIEAQLIETFTLLTINHQSLIATKANRIARAARGRTVLEFGSLPGTGGMPPSSAPVPPTSAVSPVRHAPSRRDLRRFAGGTMGPCVGADVRFRSMTPSRPTARSIPTTPRC